MKKIIIANWKLNGNLKFIKKYFKILKKNIKKEINYEISISPPILYLQYINKIIKNIKYLTLTSQNIDIHSNGPYTGEISGLMLNDIGIKYTLIGHSERRKFHNEDNKIIFNKIKSSIKNKIIPILCIGENINDYINKNSEKVCKNQLKYLIKNNNKKIFNNIIIAYEPIWAIGTGKTANINHINKIHKYIKKYIKRKEITNNINVIYGGSIKYKNAKEIIKQKYIDGLLIGNSSLNINEFIKIINIK